MKIRALISFAGMVTMGAGEVRDDVEKNVAEDLIAAGYVEEVGSEETAQKRSTKTKKKVST